jgi:hypothetical protein
MAWPAAKTSLRLVSRTTTMLRIAFGRAAKASADDRQAVAAPMRVA